VLTAALGASGAVAQEHEHGGEATEVSMLFASFSPPQADVLAGDTVHWANDSVRAHDIVARDGSFDSGRVVKGDMFEHRFETEGSVAYYCSIHPSMAGTIDVHPLLLAPPGERGAPGRPFVLAGRSAVADARSVDIEGDDGTGFRHVGSASVDAGGAFRATVVPRTSTTYRAVAEGRASPPVQLVVLDRTVTVAGGRHGRTTNVSVRVTPAAPHQFVVLQFRLEERFGWWTVRRARLDHESRARFSVRRAHAARARVLLTLGDGWTELARSRTFRVAGR
jgi:plastocyanin